MFDREVIPGLRCSQLVQGVTVYSYERNCCPSVRGANPSREILERLQIFCVNPWDLLYRVKHLGSVLEKRRAKLQY